MRQQKRRTKKSARWPNERGTGPLKVSSGGDLISWLWRQPREYMIPYLLRMETIMRSVGSAPLGGGHSPQPPPAIMLAGGEAAAEG